jgi:hypothetical protein
MIPYYGAGAHEHYDSIRKASLPAVASLNGLASVDAARSILLEMAMASDKHFDVFVFIDSDIEFTRADYDAIVVSAAERDAVIGGAYLTRMYLDGQQRLAGSPIVTEGTVLKFFGEGALYPSYHLGLGFTAFSRKTLERVIAHHRMEKCFFSAMSIRSPGYPLFQPLIHEGVYRYEDYAFCHRAAQAGIEILLDTRPRLVHHGEHGYLLTDLRLRSQHDPGFQIEIGKIARPGETQ